jgi:hypothetical protein
MSYRGCESKVREPIEAKGVSVENVRVSVTAV